VKVEYDPAKDASNQAKHGLSLAEAEKLDWDAGLTLPDRRRPYGEERYVAIAPLAVRLYVAIFTERAGKLRIISLRRANRRESKRYETQLHKSQN
jgi:uncharacterized DUF497 family protein